MTIFITFIAGLIIGAFGMWAWIDYDSEAMSEQTYAEGYDDGRQGRFPKSIVPLPKEPPT